MKRQVHNLITHLLSMVAFVFITNVGTCAELDTETKSVIAKAEQGQVDAQLFLGIIYAEGEGEGVPKDDVKAYAWFNVSSANGYENGLKEQRPYR